MDKLNREYSLGLYEKSMPSTLTWVEKLTIAKKSGFDYLEISIDESDAKLARLDQPTNEIKEAIQKKGVPISSMCLSGHRKYPLGSHDKEIQKKSLEIMKKAIDFAADLGIRIIQLAGYDVYYEDGDLYTNHDFETNLKKCVEMAAEKGIVLGFETMETPFMDTVEKAMRYVNLVSSPYLGVYPDIGNLKNASLLYGVDVDEDLMCGKGHIFASHLKETVPGKYREIPFGTGHTEFVKNIKTLKRLGVRMFVGEFWYVNNEDWQDVVKNAGVFLRDKLDKGFE
ncbi:MAG: L-ribulose-5-phosphate 3-epimerase [Holdemanella biformis]|nr:L-ribulose-5-phosphate 3-epimerase [Holdemanella biformis]MEE0473242.1 L-ribulose-5-phosphate 3-epimerase [Holdemanella biformis]